VLVVAVAALHLAQRTVVLVAAAMVSLVQA
jgi:hypothetical protein